MLAENIFILDIHKYPINSLVTINGLVIKRKKFKKDVEGIWLKDITGVIIVVIDLLNDNVGLKWNPESIWINTRIQVVGNIIKNNRGERVIKKISQIKILQTPTSRLNELNKEMYEQASKLFMSKIVYRISEIMKKHKFMEFESKVLSNHWDDDSLEPLKVIFPGFGSPIVLVPSPSAQVIEFLIGTLLTRAFTISKSFTQSYRFPNTSSETRVVVIKATDLSLSEQVTLFEEISKKILRDFINQSQTFSIIDGNWPNIINDKDINSVKLINDLNLIKFKSNIPVVSKNWNSDIKMILQLIDKNKDILMEGSREILSNGLVISSITIYPSQFLGFLEKAPKRQLQNLTRLYNAK